MTLTQLRYFCTVCHTESVTLAAQKLNISQPSLSGALRNLEREFGVQLFRRRHRRLILTEEGVRFLELAEHLLSESDRAYRKMAELSREETPLKLGVPPMIGSLVLPRLYRAFTESPPAFLPEIVEDDKRGLVSLLEEGRIDMAFLPHDREWEAPFRSILFSTQQNVCCVARGHPLARRKNIGIHEIGEEGLVMFKNSFFQTERILERFSREGKKPNVLLYTAQLSTVQNMITAGAAVGFVFEFLAASTPDAVGIPLLPPMTTDISLVWKQDRPLTENMRDLIRFAKENRDLSR